jgi:hypothetical protein
MKINDRSSFAIPVAIRFPSRLSFVFLIVSIFGMAMMVDEVVRVMFEDKRRRPIFLQPDLIWKPTDSKIFYVKLEKSRSEISRLLDQPCNPGKGKGRKLQFTSIIESLIKIRDDKVMSIVKEFENKDVKIDLGIDGPPKRKIPLVDGKRSVARWSQSPEVLAILPTVIDIDAPAVGEVPPCTFSVRVATKAGLPLFVHLKQEVIDYFAAVIKFQIDNGDTHRKRCSVDDDQKVACPKGYSFSYTRRRLVKTRKVLSPKSMIRKRKTEFFKPRADDDDDRGDEVEKNGVDETKDEDDHDDEAPLEEVFEGFREF